MKEITFYLLIIFFVTLSSCSSVINLKTTPIGLINNVKYKNDKFSNPTAGNGFLISHQKKNYIITAKHVLLIAKSDKMEFIDFSGELDNWTLHPKGNPSAYILTDQLLNPNQKDSLTWDYLNRNWETYDDFLVFSIKENKSNHKPLKFKTADITPNESLFAVGWSYQDSMPSQQVYEFNYMKTEGQYHQLKQVGASKNIGGLSGSPILDSKGAVVGLVSSGWVDEDTGDFILEATNTTNLLKFLEEGLEK